MLEDKGIRCVSDRPWVTAAETCECAMAHLGVGERAIAEQLFRGAQAMREDDGKYITGIVHPDLVLFPPDERSTYSAAAVVLCAEALEHQSGGSPLLRPLVPAADHRHRSGRQRGSRRRLISSRAASNGPGGG